MDIYPAKIVIKRRILAKDGATAEAIMTDMFRIYERSSRSSTYAKIAIKPFVEVFQKERKGGRVTINKLKKEYAKALKEQDYTTIDEDIAHDFWSLVKVRKAYEKRYGTDDPYPMAGIFMDSVLTGEMSV